MFVLRGLCAKKGYVDTLDWICLQIEVKRIRLIYVPIVDEEDANQNDNLLTLERLKEIKEVVLTSLIERRVTYTF